MNLIGGLKDSTYTEVKAFSNRGKLLPRTSLETLAESRGIKDLVTRLKATQYNESVSSDSISHNAESLEMAFKKQLVTVEKKLSNTWPNSDFLEAYYWKHVISNLKTVLKGKALGFSEDEINKRINLTAEENINRRDLIAGAISAQNLEEAVKVLNKSEFGNMIESASKIYSDNKDVKVFDVFLDKALYEMILAEYFKISYSKRIPKKSKEEGKQIRELIALEIDGYNIINLMRAKTWNLTQPETRDLVIKAKFEVNTETIDKMILAGSVDEVVNIINSSNYKGLLQNMKTEIETISQLEDAFENKIYILASKKLRWQVTGIGIVFSVIKLMELEVKNLATIAFGIEQGMNSNDIISKLIFVN